MKTLTHDELEDIKARALEMADVPFPDLEIELEDLDLSAPAPAGITAGVTADTHAGLTVAGKSQKITIRIPTRVLAAFRAQAAKTGVPYQRLMNRALRSATLSWV